MNLCLSNDIILISYFNNILSINHHQYDLKFKNETFTLIDFHQLLENLA